MSDTAAEKKETQVATPEKEVVCERKSTPKQEAKHENGQEKPEQNGDSKKAEAAEAEEETETSSEEKKPVENGDSSEVCSLPQKRKSEASSGDSTDSAATKGKDGASPEKKAKLEEKVENGEAEATA